MLAAEWTSVKRHGSNDGAAVRAAPADEFAGASGRRGMTSGDTGDQWRVGR